MTKPSVYLAGPITGVSWNGATSWRDDATTWLVPEITAFSPLRRKDYLIGSESISPSYEEWPLSSSRGLMTRDRFDCFNRDMILAYLLGALKISIGTVMEIAWGDMGRKPIVIVMEQSGNVHDHPMIREAAGYIVPTLEEAVAVCRAVLIG